MIELKNEDMLTGIKSIADNSIDLLVTDPPYLIVQGGCTKPLGGMLGKATGGCLNRQMKNVKN